MNSQNKKNQETLTDVQLFNLARCSKETGKNVTSLDDPIYIKWRDDQLHPPLRKRIAKFFRDLFSDTSYSGYDPDTMNDVKGGDY